MRKLRISSLLLASLHWNVSVYAAVQGRDESYCRGLWARALFVDVLTEQMPRRTLTFQEKNPFRLPITLKVGERLGAGIGGAVYRVFDVSGIEGLARNEPLVVKFPHSVAGSLGKIRYPHSILLARNEVEIYGNILSSLQAIQSNRWFPKEPYWQSGHLPIVPIVKAADTNYGLLIFKPEIKGVTIESLLARHPDRLPSDVLERLREIYDFGQTLFETVRVKGLHPLDPSSLDIKRFAMPDLNPTNLVWIEDPLELKRLHFNKPGFAFYEVGEFKDSSYKASNMPFDHYLQQINSLSSQVSK